MILINNCLLPLSTNFEDLKPVAAKNLKTDINNILTASLYRKSIDARKRDNVQFCCSILAEVKQGESRILQKAKNASIFKEKKYIWKKANVEPQNRPIIAGFGPAGIFAALTLAKAGLKPIVLERGSDADRRTKQIEEFFRGGKLNCESNVQFGEGGAGTFSDGKLNTGIKNERIRTVLEIFHTHGADKKILTDAKPHIGTDVLVGVIKNIREEIIALGGEVFFDTKLEDIEIKNGKILSVTANGTKFCCDNLIIATGHSARDTFVLLRDLGLDMIRKPFAMGVRIEHLQSDINKALYGRFHDSPYLSAADYKLSSHLENGRGVYSFCMCPGGEVINASSEEGGIAVNGMSKAARADRNANSALLVNVNPEDFEGDDVLAGCELQRKIESNAYKIGGGRVPITTVGEFVFGKEPIIGKVKPTVKPETVFADFRELFPEFITDSLKEGIVSFGRKIRGFDDPDAILTAPETRSSSPVRVLRGDGLESTNFKGIYPCGEGAGYAGGIMSAAVDGMCVAERIIEFYTK